MDELDTPAIPNADSFSRSVANLEIGQSVSMTRRIAHDDPEFQEVGAIKRKMRSTVDPIVSKAKNRLGRYYIVESGHYMTQAAAVVAVVTATRTA